MLTKRIGTLLLISLRKIVLQKAGNEENWNFIINFTEKNSFTKSWPSCI